MGAFFLLTNLALTILVGLGIHSFSGSIVWAVVGAVLITGSASANPIFALLAYPAVEFFFNDGNFTLYSVVVVTITLCQLGFVIFKATRQPEY